MSSILQQINKFFETATKPEIDKLLENIVIDEHLKKVFDMKYIQRLDINTIAYKTGFSEAKINKDLQKIRKKIAKLNNYR